MADYKDFRPGISGFTRISGWISGILGLISGQLLHRILGVVGPLGGIFENITKYALSLLHFHTQNRHTEKMTSLSQRNVSLI